MQKFSFIVGIAVAALFGSALARAQTSGRLDLAVTYAAERSLAASTSENSWLQGGSLELGVNAYHGLGFAAKISGAHSNSLGSSQVPLSLVTVVFGPRYRWHASHRLSIYGEALIGESNGFDSVFPAPNAVQNNANAFALQTGGGVDYALNHRFAVRLLDASYVRTQFPNASTNSQNTLQLGAGFVVRFR